MPSRLTNQSSAYLTSAAHQPIDWYPWAEEAFERARAEQKPVLLDIGAAWCHWCHVMDRETYEDPEVAELLNRDWICIKVDRDERPDVDARYQQAVQIISNQGGWPLTAFLTPDGEVFHGGTYFPPDGKYGRPGFRTLLGQLLDAYRSDPERIAAQAAEITQQFRKTSGGSREGIVSQQLIDENLNAIAAAFDFRYGGFGNQPKFPHPSAIEFVLARWFDTREPWQREIVDRTLTGMARGGVYDQLGGGFHRYSVDSRWIVPHFEKMIYDNSEMLACYGNAVASLPDENGELATDYLRAANGIADWVLNEMTGTDGGFFASQDADIGPEDDGDFFTWTLEEVRQCTDDLEFRALSLHFGIRETGDMHHDTKRNVLHIEKTIRHTAEALSLDDAQARTTLRSGIEKLRAARGNRPAPFIDRSLYVGWNSMLASAFLRVSPILERPDMEEAAVAALNLMFKQARVLDDIGSLPHAIGSKVGAMLDDFVQLARACLDSYEAVGDACWLDRSQAIMKHVWNNHRHESGGLADIEKSDGIGLLKEPVIPVQDSPTPSANGVASIVMSRLGTHLNSDEWRARASNLLESLVGTLPQLSIYGASLLSAADWLLNPPTHVVIVGEPNDEHARSLHIAARRAYRPRKVITLTRPDAPPGDLPPEIRSMLGAVFPRAYVCSTGTCAPPVTTPRELTATLESFNVTDRRDPAR